MARRRWEFVGAGSNLVLLVLELSAVVVVAVEAAGVLYHGSLVVRGRRLLVMHLR